MIERFVYLTGVPRSGTTFVGRHLAFDPRIAYVHEPFNPDCGVVGWDQRFLRPTAESLRPMVQQLLAKEARFRTALYDEDSWLRSGVKRVVGSRGQFAERRNRFVPGQKVVLAKDPTAPLVTEPLAALGHDVVYLVRHPAAVVASYRRLGWSATPDLQRLARSGPSSQCPEVTSASGALAVAVLWQLALDAALAARDRYPERVTILTYEALASEPSGIRDLAEDLDLPFALASSAFLAFAVSGRTGRRVDGGGPTQRLRRDSTALAQVDWSGVFDEERQEIEETCRTGLRMFYGAEG